MIWVIGCNGMLGTELCRELTEKNIDFTGTDRNVDITSEASLAAFAKQCAADGKAVTAIVNCAAYTAVDKAESEPDFAARLNAEGPRNIARVAKALGVPLVHISTDYVFDGTASTPRSESDPVSPLGVYGMTKADGEKAVMAETDSFYILRTAWLYGWAGKNFVYTMIRAMNSRESVKVVSDQRGTPTFCGTLCDVIIQILERSGVTASVSSCGDRSEAASLGAASAGSGAVPYGIYHVTDEGETTWYDFTREIKKQALAAGLLTNEACTVNACTTDEYPTPAKRPAYSVLSKRKVQVALGIRLPDWQKSLSVFLKSPLFDRERLN